MTLVPSLMEIILPTLVKKLADGCKSLKILIFSGELLSVLLWKRVYEVLPETTIINLYGTTEVIIFLLFRIRSRLFFFSWHNITINVFFCSSFFFASLGL